MELAQLVLSGIDRSINEKLRKLMDIQWWPVKGTVAITRTEAVITRTEAAVTKTEARNDIALIVEGKIENYDEAFKIVEEVT